MTVTRSLYHGGIAPTGLVGHWTLDDNAASSTVVCSDPTHNGTLMTSAHASINTNGQDTTGKIAGGLLFDGDGDIVDCGTAAALRPANLSVSCWFKCDTAASLHHLFALGPRWFVTVYQSGVDYIAIYRNTLNFRYFSAANAKDGNWHHAVITVTGIDTQTSLSTSRCWMDGVERYETSIDQTDVVYATDRFSIADSYTSGNFYSFSGSLDSVSLYNTTFKNPHALWLYNHGAGRTP